MQAIFPLLPIADYVLIMSVFAGFGGQKFIPESLERIHAVRTELDRLGRPEVPIEVDGGIGPANAPEGVKAGAGILVAGSSVFKAQDPAAAILAMQQADKMAE